MSETSRRSFIAVAGAGAAAGTVALTSQAADAAGGGTMAKDSVVAWVPDHKSDRLHLMVDEREIIVRDRALVRRILAAAGGK